MINQLIWSIYKETRKQTSNFLIYSSCLTLSAALASYVLQIKNIILIESFIETWK